MLESDIKWGNSQKGNKKANSRPRNTLSKQATSNNEKTSNRK